MKFLTPVLVGLALVLSAPLAAQEGGEAQLSLEDSAAITRAAELGERIYRYDQAAWHTTDAMLASLPDPAGAGIRGWIVNETQDGLEAVFYRRDGDQLEAVWSGSYDGNSVSGERTYQAGERLLTETETAMVAALDAPFAIETDYSLCGERLNRVVFPTGKPDGGLYVYFLAPQPAMDQIPFGGHYRFEVVAGEVVDHRRFTNSCLTMPLSQEGRGAPAALTLSHLLDATPTEIHVFSMFAARLPVFVMTTQNEHVWSVEMRDGEASIRRVER